MAKNIERFRTDFRRLLTEAKDLEIALQVDVYGVDDLLLRAKKEETKERIKKSIRFNACYNAWYTEACYLIK